MEKNAFIRDWALSLGNSSFNSGLTGAIYRGGKKREQFFDAFNSQPESTWYNPLSWAKAWYARQPEAQAYMAKALQSRIANAGARAKLFEGASPMSGVMSAIGLQGGLGIGALLTSLRVKNAPARLALGLAGGGALLHLGYKAYAQTKDPKTWATAFGSARTPEQQAAQSKAKNLLAAATSVGSMFKGGSYLTSVSRTQTDHNAVAQTFLDQHIPLGRARESISKATNLGIEDKFHMLQSLRREAQQNDTPVDGLLPARKVLPALAGAGLGYLGASLAAPIFSLSPGIQRTIGIGGAALGAVVNTFGGDRWKR